MDDASAGQQKTGLAGKILQQIERTGGQGEEKENRNASGTDITMPCSAVPVRTPRRILALLRPNRAADAKVKPGPSI